MKKSLLLSLALLASISLFAQKPVMIEKSLRDIRVDVPWRLTVDNPLILNPSPNPFVATGGSKAVNEYIVGGTKYDLQSNSAVQNRIYRWPDGSIATTWTMGMQDGTGYPDRGTGYNYFNGSAWGPSPTARIETVRNGWPSIAPLGNGEVVVTHNGSTGLVISTRPAKGTGTWSQSILLGPVASNNSTATLWPRMVTSGQNKQNIHIISTSDQQDPPVTHQGLDLAIVYNRSQDGGATWNKNNVVLPGMDTSSYLGFRGDAYAWAEPKGDTLAFVVGDNWYDLFMMKSTDGGNTWQKKVIFQHPYPKFNETTTLVLDTPYVCEGGITIALDNNGMAHVAFGLMRVLNSDLTDGVTSYFPITDGMGYWNETMPTMTNIEPDTLDLNGNLVALMLDLDNDQQITFVTSGTGVIGSYYQSLVSQPYLIVDEFNDLYLVFTMVMETLNNGTQHYRHIWARKSTDGGLNWSNFTDITSDGSHDFDECVFPSQAAVTDEKLHILAQVDYEPGLSVRGDMDMADQNDIIYFTVPKLEIGVNIGMEETNLIRRISVFPNPSQGQFSLAVNLAQNTTGSFTVSNVMGQNVFARDLGKLAAGPQLIPMDLGSLSAGYYVLTLKAGNSVQSQKIVIR